MSEQSRRAFIVGAAAAIVVGPEIVRNAVAGDGVALTSMAHPVYTGIDLASDISEDATVVRWYAYDEFNKMYVWNGVTNEWRTFESEGKVLQHREGLRIYQKREQA